MEYVAIIISLVALIAAGFAFIRAQSSHGILAKRIEALREKNNALDAQLRKLNGNAGRGNRPAANTPEPRQKQPRQEQQEPRQKQPKPEQQPEQQPEQRQKQRERQPRPEQGPSRNNSRNRCRSSSVGRKRTGGAMSQWRKISMMRSATNNRQLLPQNL
ncbi:hypothetical protein [Pontibacter rugosus]